jgi:hypothetical protein
MRQILVAVGVVVALVAIAPVIESAITPTSAVFQTVGSALDGGGGGW